mmetsp:Transcript_74760/g.200372  ORF Transcript_74760/g.200372 Transcript_74760/m.200372 type:complete len:481 (-) Transcript_74760:532-1974(-)
MAKDGLVTLWLFGNATHSGVAPGPIRLSPATLTYPLLSCFVRSITKNGNLHRFLERPRSIYFSEPDFPLPAGDISLTAVVRWDRHARYSGAATCTLAGGAPCAGNVDGMPKTRVDKDTVQDLGTTVVYTEPDGTECCSSSMAVTDVQLLSTGQLAGCYTGTTLTVSGGGGSGFTGVVADATVPVGEIRRVTVQTTGSGYTSDPSLVAGVATCTCTPWIFTCSSTSTLTNGRTFSDAISCAGSCYNADSTQGKCCQPGSTIGNEGGIPLCSPPTALAGNVAGNLNTCIKPVRTGCGGLKACSPAATSQTTSRVRREYPEMIAQHRQWPHGYNYLQVRAGRDGELLGNLFLKDFTQYSTAGYYVDTIVIQRDAFIRALSRPATTTSRTAGMFSSPPALGRLDITIQTPPGRDGIELAALVFAYAPEDIRQAGQNIDDPNFDLAVAFDKGPAPASDPNLPAPDPAMSVQATQARFQTTTYMSP